MKLYSEYIILRSSKTILNFRFVCVAMLQHIPFYNIRNVIL